MARLARRWWWLPAALVILAGSASPVRAGHGTPGSVSSRYPEDLKRLLDAKHPVVLVDVRPGEAYRKGHVPGARSIPYAELEQRSDEIPRSILVVLYGETRFDARRAYEILRTRGYDNLSVLDDGFGGWIGRGFPVEPAR